MKQLFAIKESGGEYEDHWVHIHFVTDDEASGQKYVDERNEFALTIQGIRYNINEAMSKWSTENPRPDRSFITPANNAWGKRFYEAKLALTSEYSAEIQEALDINDDSTWELEEVPWLK